MHDCNTFWLLSPPPSLIVLPPWSASLPPSLPEGLFLMLISFYSVSWTTEFNQGHLNDLGSGIIHWNLWRLVGSPMGTQLKTMTSLPLVFFSSHEFSMERWGSVSPSPMTGCWHVRYCANPVQIIAAAVSSWWLSPTQGMTFHSLSLPLPTLICFLPFLVWYFPSFIGDGIYALIRDKHSVVPNSRILAAMSHYLTIIPPLISFYLPEMFWCLHISLWNANKWLPPPLVSLPHFSYPAKMPWRMTTASFETWIQLLCVCIMSCCSLG